MVVQAADIQAMVVVTVVMVEPLMRILDLAEVAPVDILVMVVQAADQERQQAATALGAAVAVAAVVMTKAVEAEVLMFMVQ
jgi:hypothetical protein